MWGQHKFSPNYFLFEESKNCKQFVPIKCKILGSTLQEGRVNARDGNRRRVKKNIFFIKFENFRLVILNAKNSEVVLDFTKPQ